MEEEIKKRRCRRRKKIKKSKKKWGNQKSFGKKSNLQLYLHKSKNPRILAWKKYNPMSKMIYREVE
jgi:hypothetical protein